MSNNSQNTPVSNNKILNWFTTKGAAITKCIIKSPYLITHAGKELFHIQNHLTSIHNNSKEMLQIISEDFKDFLQVAKNQNRTEEELTAVQEKLAFDIAKCLRQNTEIICQILNIGIVVFDCVTELKDLLIKAQDNLKEIYQESKDATFEGASFVYSKTYKAIKYFTEFCIPHNLVNTPQTANYQVEVLDIPSISIRVAEVRDDDISSSRSIIDTTLPESETTGQDSSEYETV
ncbi:hypothetical protein phytr_2260 [Candidatus Phycorickettsia trachydisci]|uniref:Uncharacterized protein n=1 Tax=Candidatus Phycorickettsia trachydisci TaxID=2115978 RepID=A0A2P1P7D9_9RICK|nr:hypothetical protein [Candidatus Phycorickettsia trachydisci]AVP87184.1 hypothetical protein phytr_2260 [Candidatus Phycorickettsia trachydisci]